MTVYVLIVHLDWESQDVVGVYSSMELAQAKAMQQLGKYCSIIPEQFEINVVDLNSDGDYETWKCDADPKSKHFAEWECWD